MPESIIPSADAIRDKARWRLFPDAVTAARVLLPESFRGGCSFGDGPKASTKAKGPVSPDAAGVDVRRKHERGSAVNASRCLSTSFKSPRANPMMFLMMFLRGFWTVQGPLSKSVPAEFPKILAIGLL